MSNNGLKVFAPATVANLAIGFDILGLAVEGPGDEIIFRSGDKEGIYINSIQGDKGKLPKDDRNTALWAAKRVFEQSGIKNISVEMDIIKKMPFGSGMGSSAASAVAGAFGMNCFLGNPFEKKEILKAAVEGEEKADDAFHADNVAPSLLGGIQLIRDNESLDVINLPVPLGLQVVLIYPKIKILTKDSRGILKEYISLKNHILQSGNLASFISALYLSDFELIRRSLNDIIIEPQRSHLIPGFDYLKKLALNKGALGFSISGAGPSLFALCNNSNIAEDIKGAANSHFDNLKIDCEVFISSIDRKGAYKY